MAKLKKIAEIKAYYGCEAKDVVETLENKGFWWSMMMKTILSIKYGMC